MKVTNIPGLGNFGVFVDDVNFEDNDEWLEIGKLHLEKLVTIVRKSGLTEETYHKTISKWGRDRLNHISRLFKHYSWAKGDALKIYFSPFTSEEDKKVLEEYARIRQGGVSNKYGNTLKISGMRDRNGDRIGMFADGELLWHSNESGDISFTPGVALLGVKGMTKSCTGFMTTADYYHEVSDSFRSELDEMVLVHNFISGRINPGLNEPQDELMYKNMAPIENMEIPMVIKSPGGIKGLHYSYNTVTGIKGMSDRDAELVLSEIRSGLEKYAWDYWYENDDDLLIFDNTITQHRRLGDTTNRLALRYAFDYTYLQSEPYQPYYQEEYRQRYIANMTELAESHEHSEIQIPSK